MPAGRSGDSSLDLVFEDASSSDFDMSADPDAGAPSEESTQPPRKPAVLGPPKQAPGDPPVDRSGEGLDPFFFENFDE